jgi:hypothetical protein
MAPMLRFSERGRWLGGALFGSCLALVLVAAAASAELSSVDAYGGQAQVLGKPVHHRAASNGAKRAPGSSGAHGQQGTGTSGSGGGGESSRSPSGSESHATTGSGAPATSGSGTSTTSSATAGASGHNPAGGDRTGHRAGGHSGAAAGAAVGVGVASGAASGQSPPIAATNLADVSEGSLSLSALDVLLLLVLAAGLTGVGVLLRRWSRQSQ